MNNKPKTRRQTAQKNRATSRKSTTPKTRSTPPRKSTATGTRRTAPRTRSTSAASSKRQPSLWLRFWAVVLALVIMASAVLIVFEFCTPFKPSNGFKKAPDEIVGVDDIEGAGAGTDEIDGSFIVQNPTAEKGVSVTSKKIARAAYAENGIEETAESAVLVTLTVTPENADLKSTAFTARWKNAESEWAMGKDVSDYIEVKKYPTNQTQETLRQATISLKQPFGEVIEVQASVTDLTDKTVGTVITCNYIKRAEVSAWLYNYDSSQSEPVYTVALENTSNRYIAKPRMTYGIGTVTPVVASKVYMELDGGIVGLMKQAAYDLDHDQGFEPSLKAVDLGNAGSYSYFTGSGLHFRFWGDDITTTGEKELYRKYLVQALSKSTSSHFTIKIEVMFTYGEYSEVKSVYVPQSCEQYNALRFDYSGIIKSTDNVTADMPNVEF